MKSKTNRSVPRKSKLLKTAHRLALVGMLWAAPLMMASAESYTVDPTQDVSATNFHTLADMQAAGIVWEDGDTVTLRLDGTDDSMQPDTPFDFGDKSVTVTGQGTITPASPAPGTSRFAETIGPLAIHATDGATLTFDGFYNFGASVINGDSITLGSAGGTGTLIFSSNVADSGDGGAIVGSDITFAGGTTIFTGNSADNYYGGAICGYGDFAITGGTASFLNNSGVMGGAIFVTGNTTLFASDGDILFHGNTDSFGANAIFLWNDGDEKTLILAAAAGRSILLYDPVRSESLNENLTIDINSTDGGATSTGGTILFDTHVSQVYGNTTVFGGTMQLANGAIYGAANTIGSFTLNADATLLSDTFHNGIQVDTVTLQAGTTLAFDMTGAVDTATAGVTRNLTFSTSTFVDAAANIDLRNFEGLTTGSTYELVYATGITHTDKTLMVYGEALSGTREAAAFTLSTASDTLTLTANGITQQLAHWTGQTDSVWNTATGNWDLTGLDPTATDQFFHGDAVVFGATGYASGGTVTINADGVQIAALGANPGMEIQSGDWIFEGGEIVGGRIFITGADSLTFAGLNGSDTRTMNQRIHILAGTSSQFSDFTLQAADGATLIFDGFITPGNGGIVNGDFYSNLTLGEVGSTGTMIFSGNSVTSFGGAVYNNQSIAIAGGTNSFLQNTAAGGAAIFCNTDLHISGGTNTFAENSTIVGGGAIYCSNLTITGGTNTFVGNSTDGDGGAILAYYDITLFASDGDIRFQGNTDVTGANAIYADNTSNASTLTLAANTGQSVLFYDPVRNSDANQNLTIHINSTDGGATVTDGTVLFDTHQSKVYGHTAVFGGTMKLTNGAIYGAANNVGSYTLNTGATLAVSNAGTIMADTITLEADSILAYDLINCGGGLTLDAQNYNFITGDILNFAVKLNSWASGTYTLLSTNSDNFTGFDADNALARLIWSGTNDRLAMQFSTTDGTDLVLDMMVDFNTVLSWTGDNDGAWDLDTENWTDNPGDTPFVTQFAPGDVVYFGAAAQNQDITLSQTMQVADMVIYGGQYTFSDFDIQSTTDTKLSGASQTLIVTGDTTTATFNNGLNFTGGIGVLNGAKLTLAGTDAVTSGDTLYVDSGATLEINASVGKLTVYELYLEEDANIAVINGPTLSAGQNVTIDQIITSTEALDETQLAGMLNKSTVLRSEEAVFSSDDVFYYMGMAYASISVEAFAQDNGLRRNLQRLGALLDRAGGDPAIAGFYDALYAMEDSDDIVAALDRLGAGEVAADALTIALWRPWQRTNKRLYQLMDEQYCCETTVYNVGRCRPTSHQFWFEGQFVADNLSHSNDALAYHQRRSAMLLGVDKQLMNNFAIGAMFSYGQPRAYNRLAKVDAKDYTIGIYSQLHTHEYLYFNLFFGYGYQTYDYTNRLSGFGSDYNGHALYGSIEAIRPIYCDSYMTLMPLLAIDYQQAWTDGFTDASAGQPAMAYGDGNMAQVLMRLGLNSRYRWLDRVHMTTRMQYALNFVDRYGELSASFVDVPGMSTMLRGAKMGRNLVNLGIGGEIFLGYNNRFRLSADYDFIYATRAISHSGFLGAEVKF